MNIEYAKTIQKSIDRLFLNQAFPFEHNCPCVIIIPFSACRITGFAFKPMDHSTSPFISLLIVVFLAFLVPVLLSRFKRLCLPIVVGEMLAGILIGRSGFSWVSPEEPILTFLAEFGFVFLMFLSGMEIDFSKLGMASLPGKREAGPRWGPVSLAGLSFLLTLVLAAGISLGFVRLGLAKNPWLMGLILSTTSLGVVVPVLKERGMIVGKFGQAILFSALIADFATMFLITVMVAVLSAGLTFNILLIGLLFVAFFVILRFGRFFNQLPAARRVFQELSHATAQIKIRAAFTIMLIFVVLSEVLGTEIILGAFLAGACIALLMTSDDAHVAHELDSIGYGFLIPIFFIKVGVDFNVQALLVNPTAMLLVPLLILAAIVVKVLPGLVFRFSYSWREAISAGVLLSARLSLIIAATAIGVRLGVISEATNAAIVLVAILTVTLAPLFFNMLAPAADRAERRPVVVVGAGQLGLQVAHHLRDHQERVVVMDGNESHLLLARQRGLETVLADVAADDPRAESILEQAQTMVCTLEEDDENYRVCQVARTVFGIPHVVAEVTAPGGLAQFQHLGVSTINAVLDHGALLAMLARNPATYTLLTRTNDEKEVYEVLVENEACFGQMLRQLRLPGDTLALAIQRNGELLVPHGNTCLEAGDTLTLDSVPLGRQMFARHA
jgi:Kef-type K+ transport system membrane component KefB/Trk K+ transport system NAD-binding subunit